MTDQEASSTSHQTGSNDGSEETPLGKGYGIDGKGYGIDRRGYTPLTGPVLPVAPPTSTGESGSSVAPTSAQDTSSDK